MLAFIGTKGFGENGTYYLCIDVIPMPKVLWPTIGLYRTQHLGNDFILMHKPPYSNYGLNMTQHLGSDLILAPKVFRQTLA